MNGNAVLVFISCHFQNNKARRKQGNSGNGKKARPGDKLPSAFDRKKPLLLFAVCFKRDSL